MAVKNRYFVSVLLAVCLLFSIGSINGCKQTEEEVDASPELTYTDEDAPSLPSSSSMFVDFSEMGGGKSSNIVENGLLQTKEFVTYPILGTYYADAAVIVIVWNIGIVINMAVPVAVFSAAGAQTADYQGNRTWAWTVPETTIGLNTWTATLTGTLSEDATTVSWSMKLSNLVADGNGCCTNFEWFTGQHALNAKSGTWQFYDPTSPDDALTKTRIDWDVTSDTDKTLTFTDNSSTAATVNWGNGSYLEYIVNGTSVTFTAKNSAKTDATIITWDRSDSTGSIRYDDGSSIGCWDTNQADVVCVP